MLAKIPSARETRDVDLLGRTTDLDAALAALKEAAAIDLDDLIEFRFLDAEPTDTSQDYREGYTVRFETWLGGTKRIGIISVDLVVDPILPDEFEVLSPAARLSVEGLTTYDYVTNTSEVRVAEKTCAVMQTYATGPSSRVKDLVDLVTSMLYEYVNAKKLERRLEIERVFRHMAPITEFAVPTTWKTNFARNYLKMAREANLPHQFEDVEVAEASIAQWLCPVLEGTAIGCAWDPNEQSWV